MLIFISVINEFTPIRIDRKKDAWYFDMKDQLMNEYSYITNMELYIGRSPMMMIVVELEDGFSLENAKQVADDIRERIFSDIENNISQQSCIKRDIGEYS